MKKAGSILLAFLIIAAILKISVVTHFCGGEKIVSKLSFSATLASCGMEESEKDLPVQGIFFANHCCDDIVIACGTDNNYLPSISFLPESYQYNFKAIDFPFRGSIYSFSDIIIKYSDASPPPGVLISTSVDLSDICIYRI
jgi:hypothetical protein